MTYLSKTTQNQLISATSIIIIISIIRNAILTNINNGSRFYSIMADEATDISNKEQLSVIVRYVDSTKVIREAFLGLCHLSDGCTGLATKNELLKEVKDFGLDMNLCRGQGYDGTGAVAGIYNGIQIV